MSRFKLLHNRKPLSPQDISKQMNFNAFISNYSSATNFLFSVKSWIAIGAAGITIAVLAVVFNKSISKTFSSSSSTSIPFIVPPISNIIISPTILLVSGNADTIINYPSGTKLFIPANAFVYSDNKTAIGPFRIQFREFHDQVDQLLSGIPMVYDSAGVKKQFESAGMFDIMGFKGDEPVFIKKDKALIVDMQSSNLENNFNVYFLDTIQKNWIYDKENSENMILLTAGIDTVMRHKFKTGLGSIVLPEKTDPLLDNLAIDFDKEEFPELAIFENVKFQFVDTKNKFKYVGSNKTWDDVKITRQDSKHYLVTFSKGKFKQSFVTIPVLDKKDFEKAFTEYDNLRVLRISKFKNVNDSLNRLRNKYDAQQMTSLINSNQRINALIHQGNFQDAMNTFIDAETLYLMSKQTNALSRMVLVRKFGTGNIDRPFPFANVFSSVARNKSFDKKETSPRAHYYGENNVELKVEKAYLIKRSFNGTYELSKKSISEFPVNEAKGSDILVVVTTKKEMLYIKDKEFKSTNFLGSEIEFKMHALSINVKNAIEIKKYLNL